MTTTEASKKMKETRTQVDLVYVDASHDEESVYRDLCNWFPFIKNHGVICGDDWKWEGVKKAVKTFARENQLNIKTSNNLLGFEPVITTSSQPSDLFNGD